MRHRHLWMLLPLAFLTVLATAALLTPHPAGMGTHQALGLPPCLFLTLTGWPCPGCGLTTSFTHLVHGNLGAAFLAHPLGPISFLLFTWLSWLALLESFGKNNLGNFLKRPKVIWVCGGLSLLFIVWAGRLFKIFP